MLRTAERSTGKLGKNVPDTETVWLSNSQERSRITKYEASGKVSRANCRTTSAGGPASLGSLLFLRVEVDRPAAEEDLIT